MRPCGGGVGDGLRPLLGVLGEAPKAVGSIPPPLANRQAFRPKDDGEQATSPQRHL